LRLDRIISEQAVSLGDSFEPFFPLAFRCVRRDRTDRTPHLRAIGAELLTFSLDTDLDRMPQSLPRHFSLFPKTIRKTTQISAKIDSGILTDGINL
jgi:hypothetical protein